MTSDFGALKAAIPYMKAFRDKVFVVKLGGELCEDEQALTRLIEQFAILYYVGIKLIIVHGGGKHATNLGERLGVSSEFVGGRRVTSKEMLNVAKMSFAGVLNTDLLALFKKQDLSAVGLSGIDGQLVTASKRKPTKVKDVQSGKEREVDYGFVGDDLKIETSVLKHLLSGGYIPVICSLAADKGGQILNINADTFAARIASSMDAAKLCTLGTVDGIMGNVNDPTSLYSVLDIEEAQNLIEKGIAVEGMIPKITTAIEALRCGVSKVHILSGVAPDALLQEIFTNEGSGTMVVKER